MNWIKQKLEMTPYRRLVVAFFLGTFQTIFWTALLQDWRGQEAHIQMLTDHWNETHWGLWAGLWLVVLVLYVWNLRNFEKETLWMRIKNPAKVTVSQDEADKYKPYGVGVKSGTKPNRPPPPPRPPGRKIKQGTQPPKPPPRGFGGGSSF